MGASLSNNFYSEFIQLASDLVYTSEMFIWKFKHKFMSCFQDQLTSDIKLPTLISA